MRHILVSAQRRWSLFLLILTSIGVSPIASARSPDIGPASERPTVVAAQPAVRPLTRDDLEAWLDGFLPYALNRADIPGAVVAVVKDGQIVLAKGYGYADVKAGKPVDPATTMFRPGSISKPFATTAVMQLVEQGKLDLDADVNRYLDFKIEPREGQPITLRNILTHTSGFEEQVRGLFADDPRQFMSLRDYVIQNQPVRRFAPGKTPAYSNYAMSLAGYIVQRISGEPFDVYMARHVLAPLDMPYSSFSQPLPASLLPFAAKGYPAGTDEAKPYEFVSSSPAGALAASGVDMAHFMIAYLDEGRYGGRSILKPETVRQILTSKYTPVPPLNAMLLGFYETSRNGYDSFGHGGDLFFQHSAMELFPRAKAGIFISMNGAGTNGATSIIRNAVVRDFKNRYLDASPPAACLSADKGRDAAKRIVGTYESSRSAWSNFISVGNLMGAKSLVLNPDGTITLAPSQGPNGRPVKYCAISPNLWRSMTDGTRLAAQFADGQVLRVGLDWPAMVLLPVPWWRSPAWLQPAYLGSIAVLVSSLLIGLAGFASRRFYGVTSSASRETAVPLRWARAFAVLNLAAIGTWTWHLVRLDGTNVANPSDDGFLLALQATTTIATFGLLALASLRAYRAWGQPVALLRRLATIPLVGAALILLYMAIIFHLIGFSVRY
jgi:CubicO group peptidase (beta-lactamase class C family)